MPILQLPEDVVAKIAAGEVVERPASVVKELLENALDAGAKNIHVEFAAGGRQRIRVSDDGQGIPAAEVELALVRHATSKLRNAEELERILTLGFRGEALASIAAVSHLTLSTRQRDEDVGSEVRVEGGSLVRQKPLGAPAGTVVTVEHLFYNTPARLKFLKSENTEKRQITGLVMNYAMAYPQVRFVLVQDGRETFRSPGSGQLGDVVVKVMGLDTFREMLEVAGETRIQESGHAIGVRGFVSQPSLHRKDRTRIILFVNGRAVQDSGLTYAVTQAYHTLIEKGRHPYAVLMIDVPPDFVDVNVHPTKAEVRFQDTNVVFAAVQRVVRQAVIGYAQAERHSSYEQYQTQQRGWVLPYDQREAAPHDSYQQGELTYDVEPTAIPAGRGQPQKPRTLPPLRIVGQVGAAYIVAEGPAGMYLLDQHAAHSRVLYQELRDLHEQQETLPGRTLESQTLDVSTPDARILEKHRALLAEVGFMLESFGSNTVLIRSIPAVLQTGDPAEHVWAMLQSLQEDDTRPLRERLLVRIAQRAAIKSGQILTSDEMRELVRKLERCPEPLISPDGDATLIHMSADELERQFSRSVR